MPLNMQLEAVKIARSTRASWILKTYRARPGVRTAVALLRGQVNGISAKAALMAYCRLCDGFPESGDDGCPHLESCLLSDYRERIFEEKAPKGGTGP